MRKLTGREKRLLVYLAIALGAVGWDMQYRHWSPKIELETEHYCILSSATADQTGEIAQTAETLYEGYSRFAAVIGLDLKLHPKLKHKLYRNRKEFRRCTRILGWEEAFYAEPYCRYYYSAGEPNRVHWMMHEATHQLNNEVTDLSLPDWLEEGIACYFGTSTIMSNRLELGIVNTHSYPVWWLHAMARTGDLRADKDNKTIIPLRIIVQGRGGPSVDECFNLYYLHWWTLTHFLLHYGDGKYRVGFAELLRNTYDPVAAFERHIGKTETIEPEWYAHVRLLRRGRPTRQALRDSVLGRVGIPSGASE